MATPRIVFLHGPVAAGQLATAEAAAIIARALSIGGRAANGVGS